MRYLNYSMFLLLSAFCCAASVNAEELTTWNPRIPRRGEVCPPTSSPPPPPFRPAPRIRKSHIQLGGSYTYAYIKPTGLSSTRGNLGGMEALYEYKTYNRLYGAAAFNWKQGNTKNIGDRFLVQFDLQERLGYTWGSSKRGRLFSLFSGLGYRHNGEKVIRSGSTVHFYYNEFYIPVGFLFDGRLNSVVFLGLNFQWMPQVFSTVLINPLKGARWELNNKCANFRADLPIKMICSQKHQIYLTLQPYFEYWRDGHTSAKTLSGVSLHVPGNTYLFAGIEINLGYSF